MYLSAEQMAIANQTIQETFEQCSVAWQAIPRWDTGNPGQAIVNSDSLAPSPPLPIVHAYWQFDVTVAEALAPTADQLLTKLIANTVLFCQSMDDAIIQAIRTATPVTQPYDGTTADKILAMLINARATVEKSGYRAPSCIFVGTQELIDLSKLVIAFGVPGTDLLLAPANINALHRVETLEIQPPKGSPNQTRLIFLGRRQRIAQGKAGDATPGEEPVDLAISVPPSLEVVGASTTGTITLAVRISGALRIKDPKGLVALIGP
jgi:hypothetical protein